MVEQTSFHKYFSFLILNTIIFIPINERLFKICFNLLTELHNTNKDTNFLIKFFYDAIITPNVLQLFCGCNLYHHSFQVIKRLSPSHAI